MCTSSKIRRRRTCYHYTVCESNTCVRRLSTRNTDIRVPGLHARSAFVGVCNVHDVTRSRQPTVSSCPSHTSVCVAHSTKGTVTAAMHKFGRLRIPGTHKPVMVVRGPTARVRRCPHTLQRWRWR